MCLKTAPVLSLASTFQWVLRIFAGFQTEVVVKNTTHNVSSLCLCVCMLVALKTAGYEGCQAPESQFSLVLVTFYSGIVISKVHADSV